MNEYTFDTILKREFQELRDDNKRSWSISRDIYKIATDHAKAEVKAGKAEWERVQAEKEAKRIAESSGSLEYRDDMTDDELRDMFKRQLFMKGAKGDFDGSIAGRLVDVFNLKNEKKETPIQPVKFEEAYPDYAVAITISEKPIPVVE